MEARHQIGWKFLQRASGIRLDRRQHAYHSSYSGDLRYHRACHAHLPELGRWRRGIRSDGSSYNAPQGFVWTAGSTHTIQATAVTFATTAPVTRTFQSWDDGGAASDRMEVPTTRLRDSFGPPAARIPFKLQR